MKRKIVITISTDDEDLDISITPTGKNKVAFTCEAPKFSVDTEELKQALEEAEKYRLEFETKEIPLKAK